MVCAHNMKKFNLEKVFRYIYVNYSKYVYIVLFTVTITGRVKKKTHSIIELAKNSKNITALSFMIERMINGGVAAA